MDNYDIVNNYGYDKDYSYLNDVIKNTLTHEHVDNAVFSIIFVDEAEIQKINKEYRGIDRVTDVISFAFEDNEDIAYEDFRVLGDIYICIPRMQEQAASYGHSEKRELAFLTCHGLLHLLGYDHQTKKEEEIMFGLQELILNGTNITR
ncbi:MAG: rRNA maturation RNase YbeY [Bacilli bacterium]|nr:rRNA maturation RNase YbeY [Bacilli bacterium]